jgi:glycerol uptake facilitator-like aquaporin
MTPIAQIKPNEWYLEGHNGETTYYGYIFMVEMFATFMFVSCCLAMGHQGSTEKPLNAIAVAFALFFSI